MELLTDEESYIRIEAIDAATEVLEFIPREMIISEYVSTLKTMIDDNVEEVIVHLSSMIGRILFKIK
jgi:hypothetical protein